ncbi:transmembrane protein 135-like [Clavelina lepadiformis]|uniref:transmembrane protein 135-like n=1 Tax=Clavelina lepadiformis TaxID=159417 RepID=UPI0040429FF6
MAVNSKFQATTTTLGYFDSVPYTCYEMGHTWEPSCILAFFRMLQDSFKFSVKLYTVFYMAPFILKMCKKENRNVKKVKQLIRDILQSSLFLSSEATVFMGSFCLLRHLMGGYYGWHGLVSGFLSGMVGMKIERKPRRGMVALYMMNQATETLFNMAVARNLISPLPYGEVMIFCTASAGLMSLFRLPNGLPDSLSSQLQFAVGMEERGKRDDNASSLRAKSLHIQTLLQRLKSFHLSHQTCPHQNSCTYYTLEGIFKQVIVGYGIQIVLSLLQLKRGKQKWSGILNNTSLACFLGTFAGVFRASNCALRWISNGDHPALYGALSGAIAGTAFCFYRSTTIALYFAFKLLEVLYFKGVRKGYFPYFPSADQYLCAISLAVVLHVSCFEPHNLRPGYWKFLCRTTGNKFQFLFRKLFDDFGTKASTLYPKFVPKLNAKYVKTPDVARLLIVHGK